MQDRGDRGGHRAEVHRDVLGLHDHLAAGSNRAVEASRRSLMFEEWAERISTTPISCAGGAQGAGDDLQFDRVKHARPPRPSVPVARCRRIGSVRVHLAGPAGRHEQRGLRQRAQGRP